MPTIRGTPIVAQMDIIRSSGSTLTLLSAPASERYCAVFIRRREQLVTSEIRIHPRPVSANHFASEIGRGEAPLFTLAKFPSLVLLQPNGMPWLEPLVSMELLFIVADGPFIDDNIGALAGRVQIRLSGARACSELPDNEGKDSESGQAVEPPEGNGESNP